MFPKHELGFIEQMNYASYFLTVYDVVRYAREQNILCPGRCSAANSTVCYCLGITSVDPTKFDLLFERFLSASRNELPDIDIDFEHERREEVMQYVNKKYGENPIYDALTAEEFAIMIVEGYNPDKDFMFLQYEGGDPNKVVVYLKDFLNSCATVFLRMKICNTFKIKICGGSMLCYLHSLQRSQPFLQKLALKELIPIWQRQYERLSS